jgi:hypothetical protein
MQLLDNKGVTIKRYPHNHSTQKPVCFPKISHQNRQKPKIGAKYTQSVSRLWDQFKKPQKHL